MKTFFPAFFSESGTLLYYVNQEMERVFSLRRKDPGSNLAREVFFHKKCLGSHGGAGHFAAKLRTAAARSGASLTMLMIMCFALLGAPVADVGA